VTGVHKGTCVFVVSLNRKRNSVDSCCRVMDSGIGFPLTRAFRQNHNKRQQRCDTCRSAFTYTLYSTRRCTVSGQTVRTNLSQTNLHLDNHPPGHNPLGQVPSRTFFTRMFATHQFQWRTWWKSEGIFGRGLVLEGRGLSRWFLFGGICPWIQMRMLAGSGIRAASDYVAAFV